MKKMMISNRIVEFSRDRRSFIKNMSLGAAGLVLGGFMPENKSQAVTVKPGRTSVSFVKGTDRRENVYNALKPFENQIKEEIQGKQVLIKANLVDPDLELATTHVDAARGVLDFLEPIYKKKVIVGDSNGRPGGTEKSLRNHNYYDLNKEYNVKLVDLNTDSTTILWIFDSDFHPLDIEIIDAFLDPNNYIISLTRPKTHSSVIITLSVKNIIMGSPVSVITRKNRLQRGQKTKMHNAGTKGINFNIFSLGQRIKPGFSVLDGLVCMEGHGPNVGGTPVEHGFAIAGSDMLAVDRVAVELMGANYDDIGYLSYLAWAGEGQADLSMIDIIGPNITPHILKYKLPNNMEQMLTWKEGLVIDKM
ncbi:DUF362 domain-containing protein [Candidatus Latescibacterota bacterium]